MKPTYEKYKVENKHFYEWIEKGRDIVDSIDELSYQSIMSAVYSNLTYLLSLT